MASGRRSNTPQKRPACSRRGPKRTPAPAYRVSRPSQQATSAVRIRTFFHRRCCVETTRPQVVDPLLKRRGPRRNRLGSGIDIVPPDVRCPIEHGESLRRARAGTQTALSVADYARSAVRMLHCPRFVIGLKPVPVISRGSSAWGVRLHPRRLVLILLSA